jgi:hypothetical protein
LDWFKIEGEFQSSKGFCKTQIREVIFAKVQIDTDDSASTYLLAFSVKAVFAVFSFKFVFKSE